MGLEHRCRVEQQRGHAVSLPQPRRPERIGQPPRALRELSVRVATAPIHHRRLLGIHVRSSPEEIHRVQLGAEHLVLDALAPADDVSPNQRVGHAPSPSTRLSSLPGAIAPSRPLFRPNRDCQLTAGRDSSPLTTRQPMLGDRLLEDPAEALRGRPAGLRRTTYRSRVPDAGARARRHVGKALARDGVDARGGRGRHRIVPLRDQPAEDVAADEPAPTDDDDLHDTPSYCLLEMSRISHEAAAGIRRRPHSHTWAGDVEDWQRALVREASKPAGTSGSSRKCALRSVDESSRDPSHVVSAALAGAGRGL